MFRAHRSPLFFQMGAMSLVALLPLLVLAVIHLNERRSMAAEEERARLMQMVELTSRFVDEILSSAEATLIAIARSPIARGTDRQACKELVERVDDAFERYAFVGVVDAEGIVKCPSKPTPPDTLVSDRLWFQAVREAQAFAIGEYVTGRGSGRPSIHLAYPILLQGEFAGAANVALDVEWLGKFLSGPSDRPHTILYVLDGGGRILTHRPTTPNLIGSHIHDPALIQQIISRQNGVMDTTGLDGTERTAAFALLFSGSGSGNGKVIIAIGTDKAVLTQTAEGEFSQSLLFLGLVAVLVLVLLLVSLSEHVLAPVRRILDATDRLRRGEFPARVDGLLPRNEIGELGKAFDEMAVAVEQREHSLLEVARKDVMLSEVSHRVKNHLVSLQGLLWMESRKVAGSDAADVLNSMRRRVLALADLYSILTEAGGQAEHVRLAEYLQRVCDDLSSFLDAQDGIALSRVFIGDVDVRAERAVSVALLLNEIVSNSIKHAFPAGRGRIDVRLDASDPDGLVLEVADNGIGFPAEPDRTVEEGVGTALIQALLRQLNATAEVNTSQGVAYSIRMAREA